MTALTEHENKNFSYNSFNIKIYSAVFEGLIKRLGDQKDNECSSETMIEIYEKLPKLPFHWLDYHYTYRTIQSIEKLFSKLPEKQKKQFITVIFSASKSGNKTTSFSESTLNLIKNESSDLFLYGLEIIKNSFDKLSPEKKKQVIAFVFSEPIDKNIDLLHKTNEYYMMDITADELEPFINAILSELNSKNFNILITAKRATENIFILLSEEQHQLFFESIFNIATSEGLIIFQYGHNLITSFLSRLPEKSKKQFIEYIFNKFTTSGKDTLFPLFLNEKVYILFKNFPKESLEKLTKPIFNLLSANDRRIHKIIIDLTKIIFSKLPQESFKNFIETIIMELSAPNLSTKEEMLTNISTIIPLLSEEQKRQLIKSVINTFNQANKEIQEKLISPLFRLICKFKGENNPKTLSIDRKRVFIEINSYKLKREEKPKYYTKSAQILDRFNTRSKEAKIDAAEKISNQMLDGTLDEDQLPSAARNGELKLIVQKLKL